MWLPLSELNNFMSSGVTMTKQLGRRSGLHIRSARTLIWPIRQHNLVAFIFNKGLASACPELCQMPKWFSPSMK